MMTLENSELPKSPESMERFCITCVHLIGVRSKPELAEEKWKCGHERNKAHKHLVTGIQQYKHTLTEIRSTQNQHINDLRTCGYLGNWWEEYIPHQHGEAPQWEAKDISSIADAAAKRIAESKNKRTKIGSDFVP